MHLLLVWNDCVHQVNLLLRHLGQVHLKELQTQTNVSGNIDPWCFQELPSKSDLAMHFNAVTTC